MFYLVIFFVLVAVFNPTVRVECACNTCSAAYGVACVSKTEFRICASNTPTGKIISCHKKTFCVENNPAICLPYSKPTCPLECGICGNNKPPLCPRPGRFPVPGDTTCKRYIFCFYVNSELRAQIYTCEGQTAYCHSMQLCISRPKPILTCTC